MALSPDQARTELTQAERQTLKDLEAKIDEHLAANMKPSTPKPHSTTYYVPGGLTLSEKVKLAITKIYTHWDVEVRGNDDNEYTQAVIILKEQRPEY